MLTRPNSKHSINIIVFKGHLQAHSVICVVLCCMYMLMGIHVYVCGHACGGKRSMLGVFLVLLLPYFCRADYWDWFLLTQLGFYMDIKGPNSRPNACTASNLPTESPHQPLKPTFTVREVKLRKNQAVSSWSHGNCWNWSPIWLHCDRKVTPLLSASSTMWCSFQLVKNTTCQFINKANACLLLSTSPGKW